MTDLAPAPGTAVAFPAGESSRIRADFPILSRTVRDDRALVYLDSGATSQKPVQVLDAEREFYERHNAAVHRGAHQLAEEATDAFESAPATRSPGSSARLPARWCSPRTPRRRSTWSPTRSATPPLPARWTASTAVARRFVAGARRRDRRHRDGAPRQPRAVAGAGPAHRRDAALVPGGRRRPAGPQRPRHDRDRAHQGRSRSPTCPTCSGTVNPVATLVQRAREVGALTVLDACQSVPHLAVDVTELGVDFLAFSGHKMFGPTGIGVLWGRYDLLAAMPPFITGGSMIELVRMEGSTYAAPPQRFEAGRAHGRAGRRRWQPPCDYLDALGMDRVTAHEHALTQALLAGLAQRPWVRVIGPCDGRRPWRRRLLRRRGRPRPRRGAGPRRRGHRRAGRAPLRLAAAPPVPRDRRRRGRASRRTTRWRRSRRCWRRSTGCPRSSGWRSDGPVPGDHPRALQAAAPCGAARAVRRAGAPHQPDLRRRGHAARARSTAPAPSATITDVSYDALGCSISTAATSVLTDEVIGSTVRRGARVVRAPCARC